MIQSDNAMKETRVPIGSVVSLWRYPIKSMMGEELNSSYITGGGLAGGSLIRSNRSRNGQSG